MNTFRHNTRLDRASGGLWKGIQPIGWDQVDLTVTLELGRITSAEVLPVANWQPRAEPGLRFVEGGSCPYDTCGVGDRLTETGIRTMYDEPTARELSIR